MMKMFKKKTRVLNAELPHPLQRNAMSTLYANLGFMSFDKPMRTIVVTSSVPNEGKTTVAVELARVMAVAGKRTLLVECDLRRRSLADRLGVRAPVGLCAVVMGDEEPGRAIVATRQPRMHFLDAEAGVTSPVDILDSQRFRRLLGCLAARYDHVVIDTPPVGAFVDAAVVAQVSDATLLVVREGFVERASVQKAAEQLRAAGANLVGTVMNCCDTATSAYYAAYGDKAE